MCIPCTVAMVTTMVACTDGNQGWRDILWRWQCQFKINNIFKQEKIKAAKIAGKSRCWNFTFCQRLVSKGRRGKENTSPAKQQVRFKPGTFWSTGECFNRLSTVLLQCVRSASTISLASPQKSSLVCTNSLTSRFGSLLCSWCNWSAAWVLSTDSSRHHCSGKTACCKLCYWVTCIHPIQWELG